MRIAFALESSLPSDEAGAEVFVQTAAALSRRGHDVSVMFPGGLGRSHASDEIADHFALSGPIRFIPLANPFEQKTAQHAWQALRVPRSSGYGQSDVLYTRNVAVLAMALRGNTPVFFDHYRPLPDQIPLIQPALRRWMTSPRFLGMACHSNLARHSFLRIGIPSERLRVIHTGFDPARMLPELSRDRARVALGWDAERPKVVYTGRINEKKGLDVAFAMARRLPDVDFVLVGATGEGGSVEREAERVENVQVVPWQSPRETVPYLYAADVLLIPPSASPLRRFGRTVLPLKVFLYLAAGRPLLAGDTPDLREVLQHGRNAWLVEPENVEAAVEGVVRLCHDRALAARLSAAAKADSESLTWDARAERLDAFLEERLSAPRIRSSEPGWSTRTWLYECIRRRRDHESSGLGL